MCCPAPAVALLALLLPVAALPGQDRDPTPAQRERCEALIAPALENTRIVGLAVGLRLGDARWTRGYGETKRDGGAVPDERTLFEIGSISKVFTGVLLSSLVESDKVTLDDPVQAWLPEGVTMPSRGEEPIRLVDLSTHRSGLPRMPSNFRPKEGKDPYADYHTAELYAFLAEHRLQRAPREAYLYSNVGVAILGHVLSRAAGKPYPELLRERITEPLSLADTVLQTSGVELPHAERVAAVYDANRRPARHWTFDVFAGAGAIRSSVHDLLRFADVNLGRVDLGKDAARWKRVLARARAVHAKGGGPSVGLGWHVRTGKTPCAWHNGRTGGSTSFLALDIEHQIAVVLLSNTSISVDELGFQLVGALRELVDD